MIKKIIIIAVAVLVIGGGIGAYFYFAPEKEEPVIKEYYVPGEYFITNIKDSDYLLKTTVILEINRDDVKEELDFNNHVIRDIIIFLLREKSYDELRSEGIEDLLREEIKVKIEKQLGIDYITTIYFNDFIVQ